MENESGSTGKERLFKRRPGTIDLKFGEMNVARSTVNEGKSLMGSQRLI